MRFGLTRSPSPSPVRRPRRHNPYRSTSTYGLFSDSESDSSSDDSRSESDSDTDSVSNEEKHADMPQDQRNLIQEAVTTIRVHALYTDPYEDWERQARKEAFHVARRQQAVARAQQESARLAARDRNSQIQAAALARELDMVSAHLRSIGLKEKQAELAQDAHWAEQDRARWAHIDATIRAEEEKVRAVLEKERQEREEAERKLREEEERRRQEEEEKRRAEEERRAAEEERARRERERQEEEKRKQEEAEAEHKRQEILEQAQTEELQRQEGARKSLGMTSPQEDWVEARRMLKQLKQGAIAVVKASPESKKLWHERRRKITHRVGQLTNDPQSIAQVSQQIFEAVSNPPLPEPIHLALLSTLAKAIILQAETEVVAEPRSALPLGQMTANLLGTLNGFADIFWTKLVQRTGGWAVPASVPAQDVDGTTFDKPSYSKARGYRPDEGGAEYMARITGIMRVYFAILQANINAPLARMFQRSRFWAFFARVVSQPRLLASPVAAELLSVALDVGGTDAKRIWGVQWVKMLALLYDGVAAKRIGSDAPEAQGARVRLQLQIERVANT